MGPTKGGHSVLPLLWVHRLASLQGVLTVSAQTHGESTLGLAHTLQSFGLSTGERTLCLDWFWKSSPV